MSALEEARLLIKHAAPEDFESKEARALFDLVERLVAELRAPAQPPSNPKERTP